jgi:hypothetical protein
VDFFDSVLACIARRKRASQNRGVLTPAATSRMLAWLKRSAEWKAGRSMTTEELEIALELDDGGQGYIRQYLRQADGLAVPGKSGMTFDRMRYCVGRAVDLGWFYLNNDDVGNARRLMNVASVMAKIEEDEIAQRVLQGWKRGKKKAVGLDTVMEEIKMTSAALRTKHKARARGLYRCNPEALTFIERLAA